MTLRIRCIMRKINVYYMPGAYKYPSINKSGTFEILLGPMWTVIIHFHLKQEGILCRANNRCKIA